MDKNFRRNARMTKDSFIKLYHLVKDHPIFYNRSRNPQEDPAFQLYVCLVRLGRRGNGMSHGEVEEKCGVSPGTSLNYTLRTIEAINSVLSDRLSWPNTAERERLRRALGEKSLFGHCVGYVDGTLIELEYRPARTDQSTFYGRKNKYGFNVMAVCDINTRVLYLRTGFTAAVHDQRVLNSCQLVQEPLLFFSPREYIIADCGYTPSDNVIPSFKRTRGQALADNALSQMQTAFNSLVKRQRVVIEHCFGYIKVRFQSLKLLPCQLQSDDNHLNRVALWIRVCFLLHNFLLDEEGDEFWSDIDRPRFNQEAAAEAAEHVQVMAGAEARMTEGDRRGHGVRRMELVREIEELQGYGRNTIYDEGIFDDAF
ncbi:hypothetical protein L198_08317 [Cryptococcus wingfieldii CBS 7118]|uniref:DDE Tnp4 domain-containing protein n=1 Tax=Cryptococcus wingfieldii CBS 7118 TaxID=1295528 RepID=A0A1E3H8P9_9TREE|nr:hypothetical protein L198_08317 [Cryptococcus wingfieldii CBS 7118]ODN72664.1 hypothetical protein L198_08317 [Cryptococcus wingfieldii CBS 7118]